MMATAAEASGPASIEVHSVGVFLEEIAYFMEDMQKDLWWLLRFANQVSQPVVVRGDEELEGIDPAVETVIESLRERAQLHKDAHENQVRAKIMLIPSVTKDERALLSTLRRLKFHCKGQVDVFPCMKEANNATIWAAYHHYVGASQPQWMVKTDSPGQKVMFGQCVVVVPFAHDHESQEIKLLTVWCPEKKKRHWAFPGGDIIRGADSCLYDAARREFYDEVGVCFGRSWSQCFGFELPSSWSQDFHSPSAILVASLEKDGVKYPCRPHFFVQVTQEFYEETNKYKDLNGVIQLPSPMEEVIRWDDPGGNAAAQRVHLEGVRFLEHDQATWLTLEFETGRVTVEDTRQIRRENTHLLQQRPERLWAFLASILGVPVPELPRALPADFPMEGPFAVRMSSIDKTAGDDDISNFFEEAGLKVVKVEQFDQPKHTARIEFEDVSALETALAMSQNMLKRRKVKIEIWVEGATDTVTSFLGQRQLKEYDGPLPDEPPFQVRCRGLDRSVEKNDLGYFFWDRSCQVCDLIFPLKGEKHAGIVEFADQESLKKALSLNNAVFKGRELQVELMTKTDGQRPQEAPSSRGKGGGKGRGAGLGSVGGLGRGGYDREPPSRADFGSERPKLQLKPRSVGAESGSDGRPVNSTSGRPDPFGGARPRDDRFKATRADGDDNWRR